MSCVYSGAECTLNFILLSRNLPVSPSLVLMWVTMPGFLAWALGIELGSSSLHSCTFPIVMRSPQPQGSSSVKQTALLPPPSRKWPCSQPQDKEAIIYPRLGLTTAPSCISRGLAERQTQDGSSPLLVNCYSIWPGSEGGEAEGGSRGVEMRARQAALGTSF